MPVEQQLLPHKDLEKYYGKVTWLFVSRNFKKDEKDREALRTHDRFGISSWPQLVLFDPRNDRVLERMSRELEPFKAQLQKHVDAVPKPAGAVLDKLARFRRAQTLRKRGERKNAIRRFAGLAKSEDSLDVWLEAREILRREMRQPRTFDERLEDPDVRERAIAIEDLATVDDAAVLERALPRVEKMLFDDGEHLIVKLRALAVLAPTKGAEIARRADSLLRISNDPLRYAVLAVLRAHPNPALAEPLAALYGGAGVTIPSSNPNVLRSHVARALEASGDASAIGPLADFIARVEPNNGTLGAALGALRGIASRSEPAARKRIVQILLDAFPGPVDDPRYARFDAKWMARRLPGIVKQVVATLGAVLEIPDLPAPPASWTKGDRDRYLTALKERVRS